MLFFFVCCSLKNESGCLYIPLETGDWRLYALNELNRTSPLLLKLKLYCTVLYATFSLPSIPHPRPLPFPPHSVTNDILGRVSALELAIYYLLECASGLASGILFDAFRISPSTACLWISALALVPSVLWLGVAAHLGPRWAREHEGLTFASSSSAGPLPSPSESSHRAALNLVGGSGVALAGSANGPAGGPALGEGVALARTTSSDVALLIKGAA